MKNLLEDIVMINETMVVKPNELRDILVDLLIDNVSDNEIEHAQELGNDIRTIQGYYTSLNDWAGLPTEDYKTLIEEMSCNYDVIIDWS